MMHHTRIVFSILVGGAVKWGAQKRHLASGFGAIARAELSQTVVGVAAAAWLLQMAPGLLLWVAPLSRRCRYAAEPHN